eukprot:482433_1
MSQYLSNTSKHRRAASGSANNTKNNLQWTGFTTLMNVHDLSIFYTIKGYHTNDDECKSSDSKPCVAMNRLIVTLKYYSMLDINNNEDDAEIFRHFIHEIYYDLIDDYIHFKYHHDDQLQSIYEELMHDKTFKQCDNFQTCSFTTRHHRTAKQQTQITDPDLNFYKELMDGLHFHLFHCFDAGLRSIKSDHSDGKTEHKDDNKTTGKEVKFFDEAFAGVNNDIQGRKHATAAFARFKKQNSKFKIVTKTEEHENDGTTYTDHVFRHLIELDINYVYLKQLADYVHQEAFDTDTIKFDHGITSQGNVVQNIEDHACAKQYEQFIRKMKVSASSFNIGLRYYYWDYYKDIKALPDKEQRAENINDHSGHHINELYVAPKYASFKEEISNYKHLTMTEYTEQIVVKVKKYRVAYLVKRMTATYAARHFHYGIQMKDSITFDHLLTLILYTDWTDHCSHFSSTFRKQNAFETLNSIIKRNSAYYWMSRRLRECVEVYGQSRSPCGRWKGDCLKGPFYCGMSMMNMPSFNMRLCGPTSTSKDLAVAMKFSGNEGIVLQLNNPPKLSQYCYLHGFNVSWISRYKEENERLFFGGAHWMKIESVRIPSTHENFKEFIDALYYFDTMLTGGTQKKLVLKKEHVYVISTLMDYTLDKTKTRVFDDYLYSTFAAFTQNKTQIILDSFELYVHDKKVATELKDRKGSSHRPRKGSVHANKTPKRKMRDLLMPKMHQRLHKHEKKRKDVDMRNIFTSDVLEVFRNVQTIIMKTTGGRNLIADLSWSMSMVSLLSLIEASNVQHIILKAWSFNGVNWIKDLWTSSSVILLKQYEDKQYQISLQRGKDFRGWEEYRFVIDKHNNLK